MRAKPLKGLGQRGPRRAGRRAPQPLESRDSPAVSYVRGKEGLGGGSGPAWLLGDAQSPCSLGTSRCLSFPFRGQRSPVLPPGCHAGRYVRQGPALLQEVLALSLRRALLGGGHARRESPCPQGRGAVLQQSTAKGGNPPHHWEGAPQESHPPICLQHSSPKSTTPRLRPALPPYSIARPVPAARAPCRRGGEQGRVGGPQATCLQFISLISCQLAGDKLAARRIGLIAFSAPLLIFL